ncbi:MAG: AMP-binding protein, partial [Cyanobacteria bacterium P01_A01_bin.135]
TLVMPDAEGDRDPAHWVYLLNAHGVTLWNSVPALMQLFLAELEAHPDCGRSLRLALLSGDWLPLPLPEQIRRAFSAARTVSLGGATEASIWSVAYPIEAVDPDWRSIPYGRPLVNQQWYVLDENLQPCPVWVPGQLYIGGRGVAQGYWNRPELTADRFIAIPHSVGAQGPAPLPVPQISTNANGRSPRLYKTGDLGRYRPDGTLEFLGREDFQVKVNGYRIELGEIEAALTQHPAIREAVVEAVGEASQSQQLVAYIVPEDGGPSTPDTALNHPLARLAFKQERRGLRDLPDEPTSVTLPLPAAPPDFRRQSYRQFLPGPIDLATFSQFLSGLKSAQVATSPLPKYRYASAGSLYPVQTYLYIKPQRIDGVEAGFYYYHPADHQLVRLDEQDIDLDGLYGSNQAIAEQAAFSLFLVANLEAIAPLYPKKARDFCLLEAGYMSQLLMDSAPGTGLGLCPLGKFGPGLQQALALGESHEVLHGLAGGAINPAWTQQWQILEAPQADSPASLPEKLRQFLAEKLPTYMVPTTYQMLDALPLSANGKVDRKALPIPSSLSAPAPYAPPRTDTERAIAAIWQEVLSLEQVGIHANFFEAGGNSLSAMQAVSQLRQVFPVELSIRQFFTAQTLAEQAVVVDALRTGAPSADPLVPAAIQPASESEPQALLNQLDDLSEQDVDALLSQMLSEEDS